MAAIVFDDGRRQGIINRGLRPPSEESEGLASRRVRRDGAGSSELRKKFINVIFTYACIDDRRSTEEMANSDESCSQCR
jgi:hypothetical protein